MTALLVTILGFVSRNVETKVFLNASLKSMTRGDVNLFRAETVFALSCDQAGITDRYSDSRYSHTGLTFPAYSPHIAAHPHPYTCK
jgi:hypothetical protein